MGMYEKHIVAFVDFLGFREALQQGGRADSILDLLTTISGFQGDYFSQQIPVENGRSFNLRPAISAFSDNIVISYPLDQLANNQIDLGIVILFLQSLISYIAWNAFKARLLIRGGVAIGDAFHRNGIVFGPALNEAYETERSLSIYPRIALGPSVSHGDAISKIKDHVWTHDDGVAVLGYMMGFVMRSEANGSKANLMVAAWIAEVRLTIREEIAQLAEARKVRALAKWKWFEAKFEEALIKMPPELLKDHPSEAATA
ncbi:MAG TPA: hypothetical protein VH019_07880 [Rhizomicrobium sp.]|jgi:hypothetical protein|nr:hypothetical protein [Rhizomicrobium sp.]